jgi:dihydrofolate reductase
MTQPLESSPGTEAAAGAARPGSALELNLIVAATPEGGIGAGGSLPWRLPRDMAWFAALTRQRIPALCGAPGSGAGDAAVLNTVIMGRRTWASIPPRFRPLAGRRNIVLSRSGDLDLPAGVERAPSLEAALALCSSAATSTPGSSSSSTIWVIGGTSVYAAALAHPAAARVFLTRVQSPPELAVSCDTHFPPLDAAAGWRRAGDAELRALAVAEDGTCLVPAADDASAGGKGAPCTVRDGAHELTFELWLRRPGQSVH